MNAQNTSCFSVSLPSPLRSSPTLALFSFRSIAIVLALVPEAAFALVIGGSQIKFLSLGSNQYQATMSQNLTGNLTAARFLYTPSTLQVTTVTLDEGSDWYLANFRDSFSAEGIAANEFPPIFYEIPQSPFFISHTVTIPLGNFYLGVSTGEGFTNGQPGRDVFGWLELNNTGTQLIAVDNAVAYGDQGIIIGTTTAIVPEPASLALVLPALLFLNRRRRSTR